MVLVGFCGHAGSGKNYCASILRNQLEVRGASVAEWSFAAPIKAHVYATHPEFPSLKEVFQTKPKDIRTMLQEHGTDYGRSIFGDDYWVRTAEAMLYALSSYKNVDVVMFPDVRFQSEAFFIRSNGESLTTAVSRLYRKALVQHGTSEEHMELLLEKDLEEFNRLDHICNTFVTQRVLELMDGPSLLLHVDSDRSGTLTDGQRAHASENLEIDDSLISGVIQNTIGIPSDELETQLAKYADDMLQEHLKRNQLRRLDLKQ